MGLAVSVGILADLVENDPDGADWVRDELAQINLTLSERGLAPHVEPEILPPSETRGAIDSFPYSFLHYLRRFYAHIKADPLWKPTPMLPGQDPVVNDPVYKADVVELDSHLLGHSDAEGFYVPIDFREVIIDERIPGEMLGSSIRLMAELVELAPYLDIPLADGHLTDQTAEMLAKEDEESSPFWIERVVWFSLYENARLSIKHKTAISFS